MYEASRCVLLSQHVSATACEDKSAAEHLGLSSPPSQEPFGNNAPQTPFIKSIRDG